LNHMILVFTFALGLGSCSTFNIPRRELYD
jgi:hypothetical protein